MIFPSSSTAILSQLYRIASSSCVIIWFSSVEILESSTSVFCEFSAFEESLVELPCEQAPALKGAFVSFFGPDPVELLGVAAESEASYATHLQQMRDRFDVGAVNSYAVTKAAVDASNARLSAVSARYDLLDSQIAIARLIGM